MTQSLMMPYNFKGMETTLKRMLDEGRTEKAAGEGFYKYYVVDMAANKLKNNPVCYDANIIALPT